MDIKILECREFCSTTQLSPKPRIVKDYEIDIETGDERIVVVDGVEHTIRRGDVSVRKPGQTVYGKGIQHSILLTLDFSGKQQFTHYSRNVEGPIQPIFASDLLENLCGMIRPFSEYTFLPIYIELLKTAFVNDTLSHHLTMELLYKLNAEICRQRYAGGRKKENVCAGALEYMKSNIHQPISLSDLAAIVGLDKNYFVRLFKATYGKTPIQVLIDLKMEKASDLVAATSLPITEIAAMCGYNSVSYFIAEYKKHFGAPPLTQRKSN